MENQIRETYTSHSFTQINPLDRIIYAQMLDESIVWEQILSEDIVLNYLNEIPPSNAISLAKGYYQWRIWHIILARLDIDLSFAVSYAEHAQYTDIWKVIVKRPDIEPAQLLTIARKIDDHEIWQLVLSRLDVKSFLFGGFLPP